MSLSGKNYAIMFDLDGVLLNSDECHFRAWKEVAESLGLDFDRSRNHLLRGVSRRESLFLMVNGRVELTEEQILELMDRKNRIFRELVTKEAKKIILPGVTDLLEALKKENYRLAVTSGSKNAKLLLRLTDLDEDYFEVKIDGNEISRSKPDPEIFTKASRQLRVPPERCLVVEDAPAGIEAAVRAGMKTLGVGPAELPECDLRKNSLSECNVKDFNRIFENA